MRKMIRKKRKNKKKSGSTFEKYSSLATNGSFGSSCSTVRKNGRRGDRIAVVVVPHPVQVSTNIYQKGNQTKKSRKRCFNDTKHHKI